MLNERLIRSEIIPGTVEYFRALMQRLIILYGRDGWVSASGERLWFDEYRHTKSELVSEDPSSRVGELLSRWPSQIRVRGANVKQVDVTPPKRVSWQVSLQPRESEHPIGYAGIEAYEQQDGTTRVDFIDGYYPGAPGYERKPIGPAFEEFREMVIQEARGRAKGSSMVIKILFLAVNPTDTDQLRLDEESRAIDQALRQAEFRDRFDIRQHWAVRVGDIQELLLRHQPDIVHFSGHGSKSSEIILEDSFGNSRSVPADALSDLFSVLKDNIRCVVLSACYSEQQAQAIAEHIDCVVGMSKAIGDRSAISFATAFYRALGYGRDVESAFKLGRIQINLEDLGEQETLKLLTVKSDPGKVVFVHNDAIKSPSEDPNQPAQTFRQQLSAPEERRNDLSLLQELLDELPAIKKLDFYHPDFKEWHGKVKLSLRRIFGEGSYHVAEYNNIAWHTPDRPEDADKQHDLYSRSCAGAEGKLKAAIYDRQNFQ